MIKLVHKDERTYSIVLETSEADIESTLNETFQNMGNEFEGISFAAKAKGKKLVPSELVLDVTIKVAAGVAVGLVTKCLEKLWREFQKKKMVIETKGIDNIQMRAEKYLRAIGVTGFKILQREVKGLYVTFVFEDEEGGKHNLSVTSFDLKILHYNREK